VLRGRREKRGADVSKKKGKGKGGKNDRKENPTNEINWQQERQVYKQKHYTPQRQTKRQKKGESQIGENKRSI